MKSILLLADCNRCLVPFTSFSEYETTPDKEENSGLVRRSTRAGRFAAFAGIWTNWTFVRKAKESEVTYRPL